MDDRIRMGVVLLASALASCAVMHRTTVGERLDPGDASAGQVDVISSAIGVDREGLSNLAARGLKNSGSSTGQSFGAFLSFVSWATTQSPKTGQPTMTDDWAEAGIAQLRAQCKGGTLTGLQVVRESAVYPFVSGELVRVRGQCLAHLQQENLHASH